MKVAVSNRDKLKRLGLITTRSENRRLYWDLTDLGWKRGLEELGTEVPPGAGAGGAALYATLRTIRRYLDQADVPYQDFFQPASDAPAVVTAAEIESRIRKAYGKLVRRPGDWANLADLRGLLGGLSKADVDAVLMAMNLTPTVSIVPESNQKMLKKRDRDAAVIIGDQHKHLIAIES